jgi:hypothetical protein
MAVFGRTFPCAPFGADEAGAKAESDCASHFSELGGWCRPGTSGKEFEHITFRRLARAKADASSSTTAAGARGDVVRSGRSKSEHSAAGSAVFAYASMSKTEQRLETADRKLVERRTSLLTQLCNAHACDDCCHRHVVGESNHGRLTAWRVKYKGGCATQNQTIPGEGERR